jgi:hypothetical protein
LANNIITASSKIRRLADCFKSLRFRGIIRISPINSARLNNDTEPPPPPPLLNIDFVVEAQVVKVKVLLMPPSVKVVSVRVAVEEEAVLNPNSITIDNRDLVAVKCLTINALLTLDNQNGDSIVDTRSSVQTK